MGYQKSINFDRANDKLSEHIGFLVRRWLPDGRLEGVEWVARNPARNDHSLGSFKINTHTGQWADFATGDRGSDIISLLAYLENTTQSDAARRLLAWLGG
ncbi:MAG: hypothetical protein RIC36_08360 [Rhodospirillales bacterium]